MIVYKKLNQVCSFLVDALLIIGLPDGPTAHFKLSRLVLRKDIKVIYILIWNFYLNAMLDTVYSKDN